MARDEKAREQTLDRRTYLKLAGVGTVSAAAAGAGTDPVTAQTAGYGEGGYGSTTYGGGDSTDTNPSVTTTGASNVTDNSATLGGELSDLGGASSATVRFEYRPVGASSWTATGGQSLSSAGRFSRSVSGLQTGTEYEYRAIAEASDGDTATSSAATFATGRRALVIDGSSEPNTVNEYSFTVGGEVEKSSSLGSIQDNDTVSGSTATGEVVGGKDGYHFTGDISSFEVTGSPDVYLDGEQVDPANLGDLPNKLVVDGTGSPGEKSTYTIEVSGDVEKSELLGSIQSNDTVSGSTISGEVVGGKDGYRYSGEVTRVEIDGPAVLEFEDNDG